MKNDYVLVGDVVEKLKELPDQCVNCVVTSPPYWGLRDYGVDGQIGLEESPEAYTKRMVEVFREVRRVLRDDGTVWLNLGDSYCGTGSKGDFKDPKYKDGRNGQVVALNNKIVGLKQKDLVGIPWRVAFALQTDGWYLRSDIIWSKPNTMPESVMDRPTKAHEYIFLLSKKSKYHYDAEAIKEKTCDISTKRYYRCVSDNTKYTEGSYGQTKQGINQQRKNLVGKKDIRESLKKRNKRSVWHVATRPYKEAHFATYPEKLIEPCILAGCPEKGVVLDPFFGSGTTGLVAKKNSRHYIGIELNPEYVKISDKRLSGWNEQISINNFFRGEEKE